MNTSKGFTRPKRVLKACTECQRRKQKCSREWPCNHCRSRKAPHLCEFMRQTGISSRSSKNSNDGSPPTSSTLTDTSVPGSDVGLKTWGYMFDHEYYGLEALLEKSPGQLPPSATNTQLDEIGHVLPVIPPRFLTDVLVDNFLHSVNYYYYAIYPPKFLEEYIQWWTVRASARKPSLVFACLLLRVCSHSAQYLDEGKRTLIEKELSENASSLSERCHHTAEKLSRNLAPGEGGLTQVQQLFLKACWFKSETRFVESWHALSSAIHEAQELGMHKDSLSRGLTEFDLEMRRRVWCVLYVWDWQISRWLSRPRLIDHSSCAFELPNCRLEESSCRPGLVSPLTHVKLCCQIARELSTKFGNVNDDPGQILEMQKDIETWMNSFPSVLGITSPDTSWDDQFPYIVLQRHELHALAFMTRLDPLKSYLTRSLPRTEVPGTETKLQAIAIDCCLKLLVSAQKLFDLVFPAGAKGFLVTWCFFDTATVLCSAVVHDKNACRLPQRPQILGAIENALGRLEQLSHASRAAAVSHSVLRRLVSIIPSSTDQKLLPDFDPTQPKTLPLEATPNLEWNMDIPSTGDGGFTDDPLFLDNIGAGSVNFSTQNWQSMLPSGMDSLPNLLRAELGDLGDIWNWDILNLDLE